MTRDYDLSPRDTAHCSLDGAPGHAAPQAPLGPLDTEQGPVSLLGWSLALAGGAALWAGIIALLR